MELNTTIKMQIFKENLIKTIQQSDLPISIVYYIVKDIFQELERENNIYINETVKQYSEEQEKITLENQEDIQKDFEVSETE